MFHIIEKMFSMVWSFWNLFTFEVHFKSYENRDIAAEYMPAIIPTSGMIPVNHDDFFDFLETDLTFSILFSFLYFSVFFVLSLCSKRFLRVLLFLVVFIEFVIGRVIISYFKYEYVRLMVLRVFRLSSVLISLFLLFLSCCCCQFDFTKSTNNQTSTTIFNFK